MFKVTSSETLEINIFTISDSLNVKEKPKLSPTQY